MWASLLTKASKSLQIFLRTTIHFKKSPWLKQLTPRSYGQIEEEKPWLKCSDITHSWEKWNFSKTKISAKKRSYSLRRSISTQTWNLLLRKRRKNTRRSLTVATIHRCSISFSSSLKTPTRTKKCQLGDSSTTPSSNASIAPSSSLRNSRTRTRMCKSTSRPKAW